MLIQGRIEVEVISRFDIVLSMFILPCFEVEVNSRFDIVSSMFNRPRIDIDFIKVDQYHCDRCFFDIVSRSKLIVVSILFRRCLIDLVSILISSRSINIIVIDASSILFRGRYYMSRRHR